MRRQGAQVPVEALGEQLGVGRLGPGDQRRLLHDAQPAVALLGEAGQRPVAGAPAGAPRGPADLGAQLVALRGRAHPVDVEPVERAGQQRLLGQLLLIFLAQLAVIVAVEQRKALLLPRLYLRQRKLPVAIRIEALDQPPRLALGANAQTFAGLSGMGDLILTCNSPKSRNMSLGLELGRGAPVSEVLSKPRFGVTEGVGTAESVTHLAQNLGVAMPICFAVNGILKGELGVNETVQHLLDRPFAAELMEI